MRPSGVLPAGHADVGRRFDATAVEWVWESIAEFQQRIALRDTDTVLTYVELGNALRTVVAALRRLGVGRGDRVVISAPRGIEQAMAVLAVLSVGAAVVPMDLTRLSRQRLDGLAEVEPALVLTGDAGPTGVPGAVALAALCGGEPDVAASPLPTTVSVDDLAYVLPTSGTTGLPKLVAVPHAALASRLRWAQRRYPLGPGDVVLYVSSMAFDFSFWELLAPLCFGATVAVAPGGVETEPRELAAFLVTAGVSVAHFVPSLLAEFLAANDKTGLEGLRDVLCGGERLSAELARRLREATPARVFNQYGPTEACIDVLAHEVGTHDLVAGTVPIGLPIDGVSAYVLDEAHRVVPDGEPGLLHVAGGCLAWGYLGDGAGTAAAFLPSPDGPPGARMYNAGDVVIRRPDGVFEFLGRADEQVKIRGVRVEPAAVESVLMAHPAVVQAAVVVTAAHATPLLIAHVVLAHDAWDDSAVAASLRGFLLDRLQFAAIPARFVTHARLPRLLNSKIDRKSLAAHTIAASTHSAHDGQPRTVTEQRIIEIWAELFGVDGIGRSSDFFDLGGQSLLAMRMIARVRKQFQVRVPARAIFDAPTLAEFGEYLDSLTTGDRS